MDLINSSNFSDDFIKDVIKYNKSCGVEIDTVIIKNSTTIFYAYCVPSLNKIVIGIGRCSFFPTKVRRTLKYIKEGYSTDFWLLSKKEALFYLYFHEWRHLQQKSDSSFKRLGLNKKKYSESDADIYSLNLLEKWRNRV